VGVNAFRENKEETYNDLRILNRITQVSLWKFMLIKTDPFLENFREDADFQQIVRDGETKHQKKNTNALLNNFAKYDNIKKQDLKVPMQHNFYPLKHKLKN